MRMRSACTLLALLVVSSGCRFNDLAFRVDERLEIVAPQDQDEVTLPFELRWTVEDFEVTGPDGSDRHDAGLFAIFLDESPIPPGETPAYVARDDESCIRSDGCPDEVYLADHGIHLTTETTFTVDALRDMRPVDRPSAPDDHTITIVLLNGKQERIGESAVRVDFTVDREQL